MIRAASSHSLRLLGDKLAARALAVEVGVPVVPGCGAPLSSLEEAVDFAADALGAAGWVLGEAQPCGAACAAVPQQPRKGSGWDCTPDE